MMELLDDFIYLFYLPFPFFFFYVFLIHKNALPIKTIISIIINALQEEQNKFPISASDQVILCENGGCELQSNNVKNGDLKNHKPTGPVKSESFESADAVTASNVCSSRDVELIYASQEQAIKASFGHKEVCSVKLFSFLHLLYLYIIFPFSSTFCYLWLE